MRHTTWWAGPLLSALLVAEAGAQFPLFPAPYVPVAPISPLNTGLFFQYRSGRLAIQGYRTTGLPPNSLILGQPALYPYPVYPVAPYGVVQSRVTYNFISPQVVVSPSADDYDLRGIDLDVNGPAALKGRSDPAQLARQPQPEPPPPRVPEKPAPAPPAPVQPAAVAPPNVELPGKDVSVPRKVIRPPADNGGPVKPLPPLPGPKQPAPEPGARLGEQMLLGRAAFQAGEYGLAAQRFRRASEIDPNQGQPHYLLSQAYFAMGRYLEAVEAIQEGMAVEKQYPDAAYRPRKDLYDGKEADLEQHLKRLQGAVAREPGSYALVFLLAHQRWFDGQRDAAVELFLRARNLTLNTFRVDRFLRALAPAKIVAR